MWGEVMEEGDLNEVYIRVLYKGKYESMSLKELLDIGEAKEIIAWFNSKIRSIIGLEEGLELDVNHVLNMLTVLEDLGLTIYRVKGE